MILRLFIHIIERPSGVENHFLGDFWARIINTHNFKHQIIMRVNSNAGETAKIDLFPSSRQLILTKIQLSASLQSYLCSAATPNFNFKSHLLLWSASWLITEYSSCARNGETCCWSRHFLVCSPHLTTPLSILCVWEHMFIGADVFLATLYHVAGMKNATHDNNSATFKSSVCADVTWLLLSDRGILKTLQCYQVTHKLMMGLISTQWQWWIKSSDLLMK